MGVRSRRRGTIGQYEEPPPVDVGLAMPKGPNIIESTTGKTMGFAQAADFYDHSAAVNHHSDYMPGTTNRNAAISALAELGIRHIRHGLWSPANHTAAGVETAAFATAIRDHATYHAWFLWGTPEEPGRRANVNGEVYRIGNPGDSNPDDTFLRPLDGVTGTVGNENWPAGSPYYPNEKKYVPGTFVDVGWQTAGGLQGPNEPDLRAWYPASIRNEVHARLMAAKAARPSEVVLGGASYIDANTGRVTSGPAYATQLPVAGSPVTASASIAGAALWTAYGDYTLTDDIDVQSAHIYWGGHEPNFREAWEKGSSHVSPGNGWGGKRSQRYNRQGYNGFLGAGLWQNELPVFVTETGYVQHPDWEPASGTRYVPGDVAGELLIRTMVHNYLGGARRTYWYKLNDEDNAPPWSPPPYGLCDASWNKRASFYAFKNLLALVGFVQGTAVQQITVTTSGFTAGAVNAHGTGNPNSGGDNSWTYDGLRVLALQRHDGYLVIVSRDRMLWDRVDQAYQTVADPQTVTFTVPGRTFSSAQVAVPALNSVDSPNDGQNYAHAGDPTATNGTAYRTLSLTGGNQFQLVCAGLTQVVKLTP
jgi:hypothetical protein